MERQKNNHYQFIKSNFRRFSADVLSNLTGLPLCEVEDAVKMFKIQYKRKALMQKKYKKKVPKQKPEPKPGVFYQKEPVPFVRQKGEYSNIRGLRKEFDL